MPALLLYIVVDSSLVKVFIKGVAEHAREIAAFILHVAQGRLWSRPRVGTSYSCRIVPSGQIRHA